MILILRFVTCVFVCLCLQSPLLFYLICVRDSHTLLNVFPIPGCQWESIGVLAVIVLWFSFSPGDEARCNLLLSLSGTLTLITGRDYMQGHQTQPARESCPLFVLSDSQLSASCPVVITDRSLPVGQVLECSLSIH